MRLEELGSLATLSPAQLRARWAALTGSVVPKVSPGLLRLALAHALQVRAYGGLSRRTQQRLEQLAGARSSTQGTRPGMRLVREWNGVAHVVTVEADGSVRWNGATWRSLSEVARAITGTRWSGPAFFGLKQKAKAA